MLHSHRAALAGITLVLVVSACALPPIPLQDPGAISTAAAQTVIAGLTQRTFPVTPSETLAPSLEAPTLTATPEPPTSTPTPTSLPPVIFTPTPVVPQISVSVPTNCRSGPGKVYRLVGGLVVGETAQVYGRDPSGMYWYIRNPDSPNNFCWLWGQYATVTGNIAGLPVYTPPPSPTPTFTPTPSPGFQASYSSLEHCAPSWWPEVRLRNTGSIPFRSMAITLKDTGTGTVHRSFTDVFTNKNGCLTTATRDTLGVGKAMIVSAPAFNYNLSGHRMRATITLCSGTGQNGTCVTKTITFRP